VTTRPLSNRGLSLTFWAAELAIVAQGAARETVVSFKELWKGMKNHQVTGQFSCVLVNSSHVVTAYREPIATGDAPLPGSHRVNTGRESPEETMSRRRRYPTKEPHVRLSESRCLALSNLDRYPRGFVK
jgi:hypothetical protein